MKNPQKAVFLFAFVLFFCTDLASTHASMQGLVIRGSEASVRKAAIKTVMPVYAAESIKQGSKGVAVAEITINETGNVSKVEILEAPDQPIGQAVSQAVTQWKFQPTNIKGGGPVSIRGKLTFYFVISEGKGTVENPQQYK